MTGSKRMMYITLGALALVLLTYGILRMTIGPFLPPKIDAAVPDAVTIGAIGVLLWNRSVRAKEEKARKAAEEAKAAEVGDPESGSGDGSGEA